MPIDILCYYGGLNNSVVKIQIFYKKCNTWKVLYHNCSFYQKKKKKLFTNN